MASFASSAKRQERSFFERRLRDIRVGSAAIHTPGNRRAAYHRRRSLAGAPVWSVRGGITAAQQTSVLIPACRTSLSDIFAVGDCALHESGFAQGAEIRLESVQNAADMAGVVVKTLMGETASYDAVPWFWSNQYDLKLQTVGLASGYDETVVRGHPSEGGFSVIYLRDGQVIALDCVNAVRDYVQGRALVASQIGISRDLLADVSIPLKSHAIMQGG